MTGLRVRGLETRAGTFALRDVDLDVANREVLCLLGPSGAGKTMLLETLAGLRPAHAGHAELGGEPLLALPAHERGLAFVPQDAALFPHLSVLDNVDFGPRARGRRSRSRATEALERVGIAHLARRAPRTLSGGERQRVALARALVTRPRAMFLDEPLSALDQPTREELRDLLADLLPALGIPSLLVTHSRDEALALGHRLAIVVAGELRQAGSSAELAGRPRDATVARLLGLRALPRPGREPAYYRPEDVLLGPAAAQAPAGRRLRLRLQRIVPVGPLVRLTFGPDPEVVALLLPRELRALGLAPGDLCDVGCAEPEAPAGRRSAPERLAQR